MSDKQDKLFVKPMPAAYETLQLDSVISAEDFKQMRRGYLPKNAEDRWLIFFYGGWLNFFRSRTGNCIFQLRIESRNGHYVAPVVRVNRDETQYRTHGAQYDVELMAYLIDRYLLERNPPFPQPPGLSKQHQEQHRQHVVGEQANSGNFISVDDLFKN